MCRLLKSTHLLADGIFQYDTELVQPILQVLLDQLLSLQFIGTHNLTTMHDRLPHDGDSSPLDGGSIGVRLFDHRQEFWKKNWYDLQHFMPISTRSVKQQEWLIVICIAKFRSNPTSLGHTVLVKSFNDYKDRCY